MYNKTMFKQLAIILVNFESYQLTRELLDSLQNQTDYHFKVFISDLSRTKQSFAHSVNHHIILGDNKGFAHGNNLAIREAIAQGYEVFAVLNNDTRVDNKFVESCLQSINLHQNDIIGAKIYYEAGHEYHKNRYTKNDLGHVLWYEVDMIQPVRGGFSKRRTPFQTYVRKSLFWTISFASCANTHSSQSTS